MNYYDTTHHTVHTEHELRGRGIPDTLLPELGFLPIRYAYPQYDDFRQEIVARDIVIEGSEAVQEFDIVSYPLETMLARIAGMGRRALVRDGQAVMVPDVVTPRQAKLALLGAGLLAQVEAAVNALSEPQKQAAYIEWEYAHEFRRDWPLLCQLAEGMGLTDEQLDELFVVAGGL